MVRSSIAPLTATTLVGGQGIEFEAVRYTRVSETLLFATFDLRGKPLQEYDVRIRKPTNFGISHKSQ